MTTIRIAADCTLPAEQVLHAARDFGPRRCQIWPAVRAEHLTVHELGETTADATEGTPVRALHLDCGSGPTGIAATSDGERWTKSVAVDHDLEYSEPA